jgi:hypothetical protein
MSEMVRVGEFPYESISEIRKNLCDPDEMLRRKNFNNEESRMILSEETHTSLNNIAFKPFKVNLHEIYYLFGEIERNDCYRDNSTLFVPFTFVPPMF